MTGGHSAWPVPWQAGDHSAWPVPWQAGGHSAWPVPWTTVHDLRLVTTVEVTLSHDCMVGFIL